MFASHTFLQAGGFSPLSLSPSLWLSDTGSNSAQWDDLSGNGRHATQATAASQPSIVTNALNGRQVRRFDGVNDWLLVNDSGVSSQGDMTLVAVHRFGSLGTGVDSWDHIVGHGSNLNTSPIGAILLQRIRDTNSLGCHNTGVSAVGVSVNTGSGGLLVPRVSILRREGGTNGNGGALTVRSNSLTSTSGQGWTTTFATSALKIGGKQQTVTNMFTGDIAEVLAFGRALTDAEMTILQNHLLQKYNIT